MEVGMMTPVLTTEAFAALGAPNLVYVRPVSGAEILASVPSAQIQGFELSPEQTLYAVHRADGERLAVLTDKDSRSPRPWRTSSHRCRSTRAERRSGDLSA